MSVLFGLQLTVRNTPDRTSSVCKHVNPETLCWVSVEEEGKRDEKGGRRKEREAERKEREVL